jgi:C1A family cysteine protease
MNLEKGKLDIRDFAFEAKNEIEKMPDRVDLRPIIRRNAYDQGDIGSCTANALAGAIQFLDGKARRRSARPSRLFSYYFGRQVIGLTQEDSGAYIRDIVKMANKVGLVRERDWEYKLVNVFRTPPLELVATAETRRITKYERIEDGSFEEMKRCLADGFPFIAGMIVYNESWDRAEKVGYMNLFFGDTVKGGHAVLVVGYDESKQAFLCRNSYGKKWGIDGHFWLEYGYAADKTKVWDCWVVRE